MSEPPAPSSNASGAAAQPAPAGASSTEDRILTVPNIVTVARLCTLPIFVIALFSWEDRLVAGYVLLAIGATDWVDGYLARRLDQVSSVGKILDPVADRVLFFVGTVSILIDGAVPSWFIIAILVREGIISVATLGLAAAGAARIDVTWVGKTATFLLMGSIPALLVGESDVWTADLYRAIGWAAGIPGLVLSYYAALIYVPMGREALRAGRAARDGESDEGPRPVR